MLENIIEIQKQNVLEEAEKPEPQHKEGTMIVLKLTKGLGLNKAGMSTEQQQLDKKL
jgi:hypothetical protein